MNSGEKSLKNKIKCLAKEKEKEAGNIYITTEYDRFVRVDGNRSPSKRHLQDLEYSISREQLPVPIVVNEKDEIIDGQHRIEVFRKLKKPVFYIKIPGLKLRDVQVLNSNTSNWQLADYLNANVELEIPEYIQFNEFLTNFKHIVSLGTGLLMFNNNPRKGYDRANFEQGMFTFNEKDRIQAYHSATMIRDLIERVHNDFKPLIKSFASVEALLELFNHSNYNHEIFLDRIFNYSNRLYPKRKTVHFKKMYLDIYNHNTRAPNRIIPQTYLSSEEIMAA